MLSAVPTITVQLYDGGNIPVAGQQYSLTCDVSGAERLHPNITYQWIKNNSDAQMQVGNDSKSLFFSSLTLSDAGVYSCQISIQSPYISKEIMATDFQIIEMGHELRIMSNLSIMLTII